ncbi:MAG: membrane protein insertase YidC [Spirochaetota bacterium]
MNQNMRLMLAIGISAVIMITFFVVQEKLTPKAVPQTYTTNAPASMPAAAAPVTFGTNAPSVRPLAVFGVQSIALENDRVRAEFSSADAVLTSYKLKKYSMLSGEPVEMVDRVLNGIYPFYTSFSDLSNSIAPHTPVAYGVAERSSNRIVFIADVSVNGTPLRMKKSFTLLSNDFLIDTELSFENLSGSQVSVPYAIFTGSGLGPYRPKNERTPDDVVKASWLKLGKKDKDDLLSGREQQLKYKPVAGPKEWVAVENRYFAIFLSPPKSDYFAESATLPDPKIAQDIDGHQIVNYLAAVSLAPRQVIVEKYSAYLGPKKRTALPEYGRNYDFIFKEYFIIPGLNIRPLTYAMNWILDWFYKFTKDYAWAIILFTLIYKIITFPLSQASYNSMKKMSMLNPRIESMKQQFKNDAQRLNQEMMALYKKEKVNPLGGCLPMLLPFPILIGFFYMMQNMVELRNASFLWIKDLTSPDRLMTISGFDVNLLPILMTATSFLMTVLTPKSGTGEQAQQMKVFSYILPLVFLFLLYNMASGLVLYWTLMNLLSLPQQMYTNYFRKEKLVTVTVKK